MSFILDALKKSESDRQRRSGPALFEVKVAPPPLPPTPGAASGAGDNPDDYAPAAEPAAAPSLSNRVRRATADGVPLYQDAAAAAGASIPQLRLDLHVFAQRPQDRFVMINM